MIMNNIGVVQAGNQYLLYTETNLFLGAINMPNNGQYMFDSKTLNIITRALAIRWGLVKGKN